MHLGDANSGRWVFRRKPKKTLQSRWKCWSGKRGVDPDETCQSWVGTVARAARASGTATLLAEMGFHHTLGWSSCDPHGFSIFDTCQAFNCTCLNMALSIFWMDLSLRTWCFWCFQTWFLLYIYMYVCTFTYHIRHLEKNIRISIRPSFHPSIHPSTHPSFHQLPHACVCKMVSKLERFPSLAESMTFEKEGLLLVCPYMYLLYILCMWCDGKSEQNWPSASFSRKYPETLQWN